MYELKVGDKVRVIKDGFMNSLYVKYINKIGMITEIRDIKGQTIYHLDICEGDASRNWIRNHLKLYDIVKKIKML